MSQHYKIINSSLCSHNIMKSGRFQAKCDTCALLGCRGGSDDPIFGGCLERELDFHVRGDGLPPNLDPSPFFAPTPPKRVGHPSKIGPGPSRTPQNAWDIFQKSHLGSKMAQDGPKMAPRWPKMAPRWPPDGPKMAQGGSKMAQDGPKMAQASSQIVNIRLISSKIAQDSPKMPPRCPKMPPRCNRVFSNRT